MRTVLIVLFDDVQSLDVTGPLEVFAHLRGAQAGRGDLVAGEVGEDLERASDVEALHVVEEHDQHGPHASSVAMPSDGSNDEFPTFPAIGNVRGSS